MTGSSSQLWLCARSARLMIIGGERPSPNSLEDKPTSARETIQGAPFLARSRRGMGGFSLLVRRCYRIAKYHVQLTGSLGSSACDRNRCARDTPPYTMLLAHVTQ